MSSEKDFPAEYLVHWPGEEVFMCEEHYEAARRVAEAMGFSLSATPANGVCQNCFNKHLPYDQYDS